MSLLLLPFRKRNAFSVEALITSDAVVVVHFCLSSTSLPWSEPRLADNLLLLTLKSRDFQPVLCWTLGHRTVTLSLKLQKNLA